MEEEEGIMKMDGEEERMMKEDGGKERMMEIDGRGGGDDGNGWERRRE